MIFFSVDHQIFLSSVCLLTFTSVYYSVHLLFYSSFVCFCLVHSLPLSPSLSPSLCLLLSGGIDLCEFVFKQIASRVGSEGDS